MPLILHSDSSEIRDILLMQLLIDWKRANMFC